MTGIWSSWSPTGCGWSPTARCGRSRAISRITSARCSTAADPGTGPRSSEPQSGSRRAARRLAAERRRELEPLRQAARRAEEKIARLTEEREALDRALAEPPGPRDNGLALADALKRRAELVRLIERAESEWLAAEEAIEREAG